MSHIELLDSQLNKDDAEMTEIININYSVIMTIPCVGYINSGIILGEVGNIYRFSNAHKLLAFSGLDPSVYQSDNFQASKTRIYKRCHRELRYPLINASDVVVRNNATFKAYHDDKRRDGRCHHNALSHCAGKLVRVIRKMFTYNEAFNLQ